MYLYKPIDADVIVVGGGVAGLTAAFCLFMREPTLNILVLEASDRIGGRAFSVPLLVGDGKSFSNFDVGRQWICREQNQLLNLLEALGIPVITTESNGSIITEYKHVHLSDTKYHIFKFLSVPEIFQFTSFIIKVENLCRKIKERDIVTVNTCITVLNHITLEKFILESVSSKAVLAVINYIVFFNCGIQPSQCSALFYIFFCISTNGIVNQLPTVEANLHDIRAKGGAQSICDKIAEMLGREYIKTEHMVTEIFCNYQHVEVTTNNYTFCCYSVIIAVAPRDILKIHFDPPLPNSKIHAIENTSTNIVTNFVVTYPNEFWADTELSGDVYVFDKTYSDGPIDFCCNISRWNRPAIMGKIFGGKVTSKTNPIYKHDVLWQLAEYFGDEALNPTDYYEKSWYLNSGEMVCWNVGNSDYITEVNAAGGIKERERIYWAGAEMSREWYGFLAGGVSSGTRAALEVLYDLRPALLTPDDMLILSPTKRSRQTPARAYDTVIAHAIHWRHYVAIGIVVLIVLWRVRRQD